VYGFAKIDLGLDKFLVFQLDPVVEVGPVVELFANNFLVHIHQNQS